jgi:hypothetical protein
LVLELEPRAFKGYYVGRRVIRAYRDRLYIHVPAKIMKALNLGVSRKVKVSMILYTDTCQSQAYQYHGAVIKFVAKPFESGRFGSSYRITIPSNYGWVLSRLAGCAKVDVWLEPVREEQPGEPQRVEVQALEEGEGWT